jgi:hypothetical protein
MHIRVVEIQNFRKLESIRVDLTHNTTVFVGPNNSGKTSAMTALQYFLVYQSRFTPDDFTASNWQPINQIGSDWESNPSEPLDADNWRAVLPSLDLWLDVGDDELHYVSQFLPTLDWAGGLLGVRLQLEPKDVEDCRGQYLSAIAKAKETLSSIPKESDSSAKAPKLGPVTCATFWNAASTPSLPCGPMHLIPLNRPHRKTAWPSLRCCLPEARQ